MRHRKEDSRDPWMCLQILGDLSGEESDVMALAQSFPDDFIVDAALTIAFAEFMGDEGDIHSARLTRRVRTQSACMRSKTPILIQIMNTAA